MADKMWVTTDGGRATYIVKLFRLRPYIGNDGRWRSEDGAVMSAPQSRSGLKRNSLAAPGNCIEFRRVEANEEKHVPLARVLEIVENYRGECVSTAHRWAADDILRLLREEFE